MRRPDRMGISAGLVALLVPFVLLTSTGTAAAQDYSLPVRWCVIGDDANDDGDADAGEEGALAFTDPSLVGEPNTDSVLWRRHERISDRTLIPQAAVTLRSALWNIVGDPTLNFPIIPDPDTSDPDHEYGDLLSSPRDERDLARDACIQAWQDDHGVDDIGIMAIVARRLVDEDGDAVSNGVGRLGNRLLWVHDNAFVLPDPTPEGDLRDPFDGTFGHEFGHAHPGALRHVDNDTNIMRSSPADNDSDGVRDNFDLSSSIVDVEGDTIDQIDLINDDSPMVPGCKLFGTNTDCSTRSDAHVDEPGDADEGFLDIRLVTLADVDGVTTRVILELANALDDGVLEFDTVEYLVFLDADGDITTGGAPADLGFDTAMEGAEVVIQVELRPEFEVARIDDGLPNLSTPTTLWRFDLREQTFIQSDEGKVLVRIDPIIDIIDPIAPQGQSIEELVGHAIRIEFATVPGAVLGQGPRVQSISQGVREGQATLDLLDDGPDEATNFRLVFPTFPLCTVSPDPVQPGAAIQVNASGLLPDMSAHVILGIDEIGSADTDGTGSLNAEFDVPATTDEGTRLVTIGTDGTGLTADCSVTVAADANNDPGSVDDDDDCCTLLRWILVALAIIAVLLVVLIILLVRWNRK